MDPIRTDQSSHLASSATTRIGNTLEDFGGNIKVGFPRNFGRADEIAGTPLRDPLQTQAVHRFPRVSTPNLHRSA